MSKVTSNILDLIEVDVSELTPFQGKLKTLSPENYQKLKSEILKTGFNFAQHVWPNEGQLYIIDGHQRKTALEMMRAEGIEIPVRFPKSSRGFVLEQFGHRTKHNARQPSHPSSSMKLFVDS